MSSYETPVRWRDDVGWEKRCDDCAARNVARFWPLTDEFWDKRKTMRRCRSCQRSFDAKRARALYLSSTTYRERRRAASRKYHRETRAAQYLRSKTRWAQIVADPLLHEQQREKARAAQARYRERQRALKAAA